MDSIKNRVRVMATLVLMDRVDSVGLALTLWLLLRLVLRLG